MSFLFAVSRSQDNSRRPIVKLDCKSSVTDFSLWFQESTISPVIRTGNETAQAFGVCQCDRELITRVYETRAGRPFPSANISIAGFQEIFDRDLKRFAKP